MALLSWETDLSKYRFGIHTGLLDLTCLGSERNYGKNMETMF